MSDGLDDLLGPDSDTSSGGGLRKQLEAVLAERKALQDQLAALAEKDRGRDLQSLFAKHSIPELARDFFPKDAELTDESATSFVEKYGQLWGAQAAPATTTPEQQAATAAVQQFAAQSSPAPTGLYTQEYWESEFAKAQTHDELVRMISEAESIAAQHHGIDMGDN